MAHRDNIFYLYYKTPYIYLNTPSYFRKCSHLSTEFTANLYCICLNIPQIQQYRFAVNFGTLSTTKSFKLFVVLFKVHNEGYSKLIQFIYGVTVCPRSLGPFHIITCYKKKWVQTTRHHLLFIPLILCCALQRWRQRQREEVLTFLHFNLDLELQPWGFIRCKLRNRCARPCRGKSAILSVEGIYLDRQPPQIQNYFFLMFYSHVHNVF